jgi:hypothetical protein
MSDFLYNPEYHHHLSTAIGYGLKVVVAMLIVSGILTVAGGGTSALGWAKARESAGH